MALINDLIPLILDADDHWWPNHLVTLASLSPAWLFYVRKRLYPYPTIHSFPAAKLLADTLTHNPELGSMLKGISLRPTITENCRPKPVELKALRFLLGVEGLTRITLGGELAVRAEKFLRLIGNPDILEELYIDGNLLSSRISSCPSLEWDESFSFGFPNLRKLRITHVELDIIPPSTEYPYPSSISKLILEDVHLMHGDIVHLLNGATSLECLHLTTIDPTTSDEQLRLVLASCTVDCLHYEIRKDSNSSSFPDPDLGHADSLRCLHLDGQFVDMGVLITVSEIFRNLVELVVSGRGVRVSPQEWARFIRSGSLSSLRRLGLPWGTNIPPFVGWQSTEIMEIRDACISRGELVIQ